MEYERTLTSMINPEVVTKASGSWQLTGKIDDLDYADLVNLRANIEFALWDYDSKWMTEDNLTDVEADADTLASAGWGTDEDYGG
jgi:hypothetical protein